MSRSRKNVVGQKAKKGITMKKSTAPRSLFSVDAVKKTITASVATLSRAQNPNSDEYIELGLLLADHPGFKVKEKTVNKVTYGGLTI